MLSLCHFWKFGKISPLRKNLKGSTQKNCVKKEKYEQIDKSLPEFNGPWSHYKDYKNWN